MVEEVDRRASMIMNQLLNRPASGANAAAADAKDAEEDESEEESSRHVTP